MLWPRSPRLDTGKALGRIFIDMDGVVVDYDGLRRALNVTSDALKRMPGAFLVMNPLPGALEAVRLLIAMGYPCWIATRPPTGVPAAYAEKAQWIVQHLPELADRVIVTPDKGLLGDEVDFLIDDQPHKANCQAFRGKVLHFGAPFGWVDVVQFFREHQLSLYGR